MDPMLQRHIYHSERNEGARHVDADGDVVVTREPGPTQLAVETSKQNTVAIDVLNFASSGKNWNI
jgi:hypothetical protein